MANPRLSHLYAPPAPLLLIRSEWTGQLVRVQEPGHAGYRACVVGVMLDGDVLNPRVVVRMLESAEERTVRIADVAILH